ncbi:hypothetical protein BCR44DRAFT_1499496 [Catenaria anguillulae PL171]|uniref:Fungal lipase-type domain-containing protein n=1 Tax=Catenaria anguillulae PL171 TaxID=765915 RepID=A0A1Y2HP76_9FUNG|nr:hypothetical protein BCR44DRAFT_1499496 [Catenaria anguillulae PL171]
MTIHIRHHDPADADAASGNRPLVSTLWLITLGVVWVASLVSLPLLVWNSLLLPALASAVLAATLPFGAGLLVSGLAIHRRVAHSLDAIVRLLLAASSVATPIARRIHHTPIVASVVTGVLKVSFFAWFTGLVLTDRVLRRVLSKLAGKHVATSRHFSLVNAPDPCFQPAGIFSDIIDDDNDHQNGGERPATPEGVTAAAAQGDGQQEQTSDMLLRAQGIPFRPKTAYSMAMAAKLAYEDLAIVRHELEAAGYDMETFQPIHYRNTCGFVVAKGRKIIVIFRGTAPLNAANILTDIRHHMCPAAEPTSGVEMGQVHEGFLDALGPVEHMDDDDEPNLVPFDIGSPDPYLPPTSAAALAATAGGSISKRTGKRLAGGHRRTRSTATGGSASTRRRLRQTRKWTRSRTIRLELHAHSLTSALVSSVRALATVTDVVVRQVAKHVSDPIERFTHVDNREESAYVQAHRAIAACLAKMQVRERMVGVVKRHREDLVRQMKERRRESGRYGEWGVETSDDTASMCSGMSRDEGPRVVYRMHRSDSGLDERLRHEGVGSSSSSSSDEEDIDVAFSSDDEDQDSGPIRLYIGGHSLGGAVAHVFLAKLAECNSTFLDFFDGLYTFGSPRVGDLDFQAYLDARFNNLFRIVYNKDIVPRVPPINPYAELPGHLVTLSPLGKMVFRPPGTLTRPVNFISPSGLLSPTVIFQLRNESFLRFVYRILLPFYVNDHMPSDYVAALQKYAY